MTTSHQPSQSLAHAAFCSSADFSHAVHLTPVLSPKDAIHLRLTTPMAFGTQPIRVAHRLCGDVERPRTAEPDRCPAAGVGQTPVSPVLIHPTSKPTRKEPD
jgi:hypothetical protein